MDKLFVALKQELVRNKKKSAILGLMCLVALYFWAPLVWGWIAPDSDEDLTESPVGGESFVITPPTASDNTAAAAARTQTERRREIPWEQLVRQIAEDQRMMSATLPVPFRNPFAPVAKRQPEAEPPLAASPSPPLVVEDFAPADLRLELTGILFGPGTRVATINGRQYHENEVLDLDGATIPVAAVEGVNASLDVASADAALGAAAADLAAVEASPPDGTAGQEAGTPPDAAVAAAPPRDASAGDVPARRGLIVIAAIQPKSVLLRLSNGTVKELTLAETRLATQDVIQIMHTDPKP